MSHTIYRLTALHLHIDQAIRAELNRRMPDGLRLFRLRKLKQAIRTRLTRSFVRTAPPAFA